VAFCRSIGLGEQPRRIAHQASTGTFAVVTLIPHIDASGAKIMSQDTWEEVAALQLEPDELGASVTTLPDPDNPDGEVRRRHAMILVATLPRAVVLVRLFPPSVPDCSVLPPAPLILAIDLPWPTRALAAAEIECRP
jgi:hypothetical protein